MKYLEALHMRNWCSETSEASRRETDLGLGRGGQAVLYCFPEEGLARLKSGKQTWMYQRKEAFGREAERRACEQARGPEKA